MFIGHYGVALAAKRVAPRTPLGALFVAVQLLDVVFALLVLAGIEKLRIVPGFTRVTPYDLYFMPYSHSLAGAVLWSALGALGFGLIATGVREKKARVTAALVFGVAVLSHFLLDLPVHVADLPLGFDASSPKVGLGLWDQVDVTLALELGLLVAGGALYAGATLPRPGKETATRVVAVILVALTVATPFLPIPPDTMTFAFEALGGYLVLAALAEWMDRSRVPG
ncbi:MAG: hypothetical protein ACLQVI_38005 [Polyangiaceae bacterium]